MKSVLARGEALGEFSSSKFWAVEPRAAGATMREEIPKQRCKSSARDSATGTDKASEKPRKKTTVGLEAEDEGEEEGVPQPFPVLASKLAKYESKYCTLARLSESGSVRAAALRRWLASEERKVLAGVEAVILQATRSLLETEGPP